MWSLSKNPNEKKCLIIKGRFSGEKLAQNLDFFALTFILTANTKMKITLLILRKNTTKESTIVIVRVIINLYVC